MSLDIFFRKLSRVLRPFFFWQYFSYIYTTSLPNQFYLDSLPVLTNNCSSPRVTPTFPHKLSALEDEPSKTRCLLSNLHRHMYCVRFRIQETTVRSPSALSKELSGGWLRPQEEKYCLYLRTWFGKSECSYPHDSQI